MQHDCVAVGQSDPEWNSFVVKLEAAEEEFARGRPDDFKALWLHSDDVTLSGAFGGEVERGWDKVAARLDWASSKYAEGTRSRREVGGMVGRELAYLVQYETIEARIAGRADRIKQELRSTMVFRQEGGTWRILHRHADSQLAAWPPRDSPG